MQQMQKCMLKKGGEGCLVQKCRPARRF